MIESDFLTKEIEEQLRKYVIRGNSKGYINLTSSGPKFELEPGQVLADVICRLGGPSYPTKSEMQIQIDNNRPMVIVAVTAMSIDIFAFGDYLLNEPLLNRPFRYGITDCWEAIRSWKWQKEGQYLAPIARENHWWYKGATPNGVVDREGFSTNPNYYLKLYKELGYSIVRPDDPQVGDGIFFQTKGSTTVNHVGIYVGDGEVYHHLEGRTSEVVDLEALKRTMTLRMWVRRTDRLYPDKK